MTPGNLKINEFDYELPPAKIANYPLEERDSSRLLIYQNKQITESVYRNIPDFLQAGYILVFNNTRVIKARLLFYKLTGARIELFCLEPHEQYADTKTALSQTREVYWKCLVGGASKWKMGHSLEMKLGNENDVLRARITEKRNDTFIIHFSWDNFQWSFAEILQLAGHIPLPPYIKRSDDSIDRERYQTVYALQNGSVAAPTAGLHFTPQIFQSLLLKNIEHDFVTLHTGAGTFKPVKATYLSGHDMHEEFIEVEKRFIESLATKNQRNIIAVGTTSIRTLESLYWLGVKCILNPSTHAGQLCLNQWESYTLDHHKINVNTALDGLLQWMDDHQLQKLITKTRLLIAPSYSFKIVRGLITNFHQPQSTLLLLVAAFIGNDWRKVYDYALQNNFRFLSYGDGCLLLP